MAKMSFGQAVINTVTAPVSAPVVGPETAKAVDAAKADEAPKA